MSAPRRLSVVVTLRFERALEAIPDRCDSRRRLHADALWEAT